MMRGPHHHFARDTVVYKNLVETSLEAAEFDIGFHLSVAQQLNKNLFTLGMKTKQ